jgi:hypothetical protein
MKAEHETMAEATARQHGDTTDIFDDDFEPDARESYLEELRYDWHAIRAARAEARSCGEHLPLTPFQLRIGREYARIQTAIRKDAAKRVPPRSSSDSRAAAGASETHEVRAAIVTPSEARGNNPSVGSALVGAEQDSAPVAGPQSPAPPSRRRRRFDVQYDQRLEKTLRDPPELSAVNAARRKAGLRPLDPHRPDQSKQYKLRPRAHAS